MQSLVGWVAAAPLWTLGPLPCESIPPSSSRSTHTPSGLVGQRSLAVTVLVLPTRTLSHCLYHSLPLSTTLSRTLLCHVAFFQALSDAGFDAVVASNVTDLFVRCLEAEMVTLEAAKESFLTEFSLADFNYLMDGWKAKVVRCAAGLQTWGLFECVKP